MILIEKCPLCEGVSFIKKITCQDHTQSKEKFQIVSCETCGFTLTNPRPNNDSIDSYYKSEMYISHTNSSKGLFSWLYQTIRAHTIRRKVVLLKNLKKEGRHLDIGCGTGEFLYACKKSGYKTEGIEPSALARKQAIKNHDLSVSQNTDLTQYSKSEFDSISMWHVLEHIPNLNETISNFNKIIKPDGKIIIAVPNHECWDANYYNEYWAGWDVPIHFWHFSQNTIKRVFKKHKFNLVEKKAMVFDSYYVSLLSEEFMTGNKNFIKGFIIGLVSNLFGLLTKKGHSSIIYIFEKEK
jgi:2-polyprenyl-3-methyl-5-hydroxy-6-metoxy-1,4-benzoquinol methylase